MTSTHLEAAEGGQTLAAVLEAQRDITRQLLGVARRQQQAIIEGDVEGLTASVDESQIFLEHLQALETERMTALVAIAMATGVDADRATLSDIAAALPAESAEAVRRSGQALRAEATALQEAEAVNQHLLEGSRALVDRWVNYLRTVLAGGVYTPAGGTAAHGGRTLDRSA
ncbi:MAG: flagellar protein FlgN [Dehalococcoidia bacterium]|nr:MAG: flagellar protein FlgN [Dehalococcoidia bacterium]